MVFFMAIQIRRAQMDDLVQLTALARKTYADAYGADMPSAELETHLEVNLSEQRIAQMLKLDVFLLAESAERLVGFVQFGTVNTEAWLLIESVQLSISDQEIRRLYIRADLQNQGLGRELMEIAFEQIQGVQTFVDVWHTNTRAQRFYARCGFEQVGERPYISTVTGEVSGMDLILCRPA
jgi:diamine N-acetyltransferase